METICEFFVKKRNGCDGIEQGDYVLDQDDLSSLDEGVLFCLPIRAPIVHILVLCYSDTLFLHLR